MTDEREELPSSAGREREGTVVTSDSPYGLRYPCFQLAML